MDVKLIVASGKNKGESILVTGPKFFIGRSEDCHLRPNSDLVSRHHCAIIVEEGYAAVRDFGSKNGSFVNGERVQGEQELKRGDMLQVGPLNFEVELVVELAAKKKPKVHSIEEAAARTVKTAASARRDQDDIDLDDWLGDDEPSGETTVAVAPAAKEFVMPEASETSATPDTEQSAVQGEGGGQPEKPAKQPPKKFHALKKKSENTQSAAADTLKQMFGR